MENGTTHSAAMGTKADNNDTLTLKKVQRNFPFSAREGCVACGCGSTVFVFGGVIQGDAGAEPQETNELLSFDVASEKWQKVKTTGTPPPARAASSLVAVGNKLYLFGGLSHMFGWFDDLFMFDTESGKWSALDSTGNKPRARDKLQAVAIGTNIYYFGGFGPKTDQDLEDLEEESEEEEEIPEAQNQQGAEFGWFNDIYVLDTVSCQWSQPMQMNLECPTPRAAHGMCAVGTCIYIFGGRDIEDRQNDLHCYNTVTRKWDAELKPKGTPPPPCSFHTLTAVGDRLVVIGGRERTNAHSADIYIFNTATKEWLKPQLKGVAMSARGQHSAVVVGQKLVVFGGTGKFSAETMQCQEFYTDTFLVDTEELLAGAANTAANGDGDA